MTDTATTTLRDRALLARAFTDWEHDARQWPLAGTTVTETTDRIRCGHTSFAFPADTDDLAVREADRLAALGVRVIIRDAPAAPTWSPAATTSTT